MACASFELVEDDPLQCAHCARCLRRALQRLPGIEAVTISIEKQRIASRSTPFCSSPTRSEKSSPSSAMSCGRPGKQLLRLGRHARRSRGVPSLGDHAVAQKARQAPRRRSPGR